MDKEIKKEKTEKEIPGEGKIDVLKKYNVSGKMLNQGEIDMLVKRYRSQKGEK